MTPLAVQELAEIATTAGANLTRVKAELGGVGVGRIDSNLLGTVNLTADGPVAQIVVVGDQSRVDSSSMGWTARSGQSD